MQLLVFAVVGLVVGCAAALVDRRGSGLLGNSVVGALGGLIAGFLAELFVSGSGATGLTPGGVLFAGLGATLLVLLLRAVHHQPTFD